MIFAGCGGVADIGPPTSASNGTSLYIGNGILSWNASTQYTDGSPLVVHEYRVYFSSDSGIYSPGIYNAVSNATPRVYVKNFNLPVGHYYFVVTAVDSTGNESDFSNEVSADLS